MLFQEKTLPTHAFFILSVVPHFAFCMSQVRVLHRTKNALALMQSFDLNVTYAGVIGGTSLIGRSTACIGMAVMYRYRYMHIHTHR